VKYLTNLKRELSATTFCENSWSLIKLESGIYHYSHCTEDIVKTSKSAQLMPTIIILFGRNHNCKEYIIKGKASSILLRTKNAPSQ
jgi:hypothetical protein